MDIEEIKRLLERFKNDQLTLLDNSSTMDGRYVVVNDSDTVAARIDSIDGKNSDHARDFGRIVISSLHLAQKCIDLDNINKDLVRALRLIKARANALGPEEIYLIALNAINAMKKAGSL